MIYWDVESDDRIVWGYSSKYELQIVDGQGRLLRTIIKGHVPVRTTDAEKEEWVKFAFGDQGIPPDVKVNWPSHHNAFQSINVDDTGRIFVGTFEEVADGRGFYYDVFDPEGRYIVRVPLKAVPRAIRKDRLYAIEEDEDGNAAVKRYKITWGSTTREMRPL